MFIDTHLHLSEIDYDDINEVINAAKNNDVNILIVSCCTKDSIEEGLSLIEQFSNIYLTIGYHPEEADQILDSDLVYLEKLVKSNKRIVGIGEIGLDYHYTKENILNQQTLFKKQLQIAEKLHKPVVIHSRDAIYDTQTILKEYPNVKGIIHCFSGSLETAKEYIKIGYMLGIGGVLTFKNSKLLNVVKEISLSNIVLETDSPYLSPEPFRGKVNGPKNIPIIAKYISEIKNVSIEEVASITANNAITLFDLSKQI